MGRGGEHVKSRNCGAEEAQQQPRPFGRTEARPKPSFQTELLTFAWLPANVLVGVNRLGPRAFLVALQSAVQRAGPQAVFISLVRLEFRSAAALRTRGPPLGFATARPLLSVPLSWCLPAWCEPLTLLFPRRGQDSRRSRRGSHSGTLHGLGSLAARTQRYRRRRVCWRGRRCSSWARATGRPPHHPPSSTTSSQG